MTLDDKFYIVVTPSGHLVDGYKSGTPKLYIHKGTAQRWAKAYNGDVFEVVLRKALVL